jgi:hypothetical protein
MRDHKHYDSTYNKNFNFSSADVTSLKIDLEPDKLEEWKASLLGVFARHSKKAHHVLNMSEKDWEHTQSRARDGCDESISLVDANSYAGSQMISILQSDHPRVRAVIRNATASGYMNSGRDLLRLAMHCNDATTVQEVKSLLSQIRSDTYVTDQMTKDEITLGYHRLRTDFERLPTSRRDGASGKIELLQMYLDKTPRCISELITRLEDQLLSWEKGGPAFPWEPADLAEHLASHIASRRMKRAAMHDRSQIFAGLESDDDHDDNTEDETFFMRDGKGSRMRGRGGKGSSRGRGGRHNDSPRDHWKSNSGQYQTRSYGCRVCGSATHTMKACTLVCNCGMRLCGGVFIRNPKCKVIYGISERPLDALGTPISATEIDELKQRRIALKPTSTRVNMADEKDHVSNDTNDICEDDEIECADEWFDEMHTAHDETNAIVNTSAQCEHNTDHNRSLHARRTCHHHSTE